MLRSIALGIVLSLIIALPSFSVVQNSPIGGQVFTGNIEIDAPAEKVWAILTDLKTLTEAIGFEFISGKDKVSAVGDTARIKVWSDNTTYLLTYMDANNELRFALEPDNASYLCQSRWLLESSGTKTLLTVIDTYTESAEQSKESLDSQAAKWEKNLAKIKALAEAS